MSIQEWLDGPQDYEAGRLLYTQLGQNAQLKRTLSHGPTAYNTSALREELVKLAKAGQGQAVVQLVPVVAAAAVVEMVLAGQSGAAPASAATAAPAALASEVEQQLADLASKWKPLYKDASTIQAQLEYAKDEQQRCEWSFRVLDLMDQVQALWDTSDYVREHGQLPPVPVVTPPPSLDLTDRAVVRKRRNGLRSQVSKQKDNAERAVEVAAWRVEIEQLTALLKTL